MQTCKIFFFIIISEIQKKILTKHKLFQLYLSKYLFFTEIMQIAVLWMIPVSLVVSQIVACPVNWLETPFI